MKLDGTISRYVVLQYFKSSYSIDALKLHMFFYNYGRLYSRYLFDIS